MLVRIPLFAAALTFGIAAPVLAEPDARSLIEAHVKAVGGIDAFDALTAVHRCGTIRFFENADNGPSGAFHYETALRVPDLLAERLARPQEMLVQRGYDHGEIWDTSDAPSHQPAPEREAMMEDTIHSANRDGIVLLKVAARAEIALRPAEVPATDTCVRVPSIPEIPMHCYSGETGFLTYLVRGDSVRKFEDWRKVGEVMLPFQLTQSEAGQVVYQIQLESAETNPVNITAVADAMRQAVSPSERLSCSPGPRP